LLPFWYHFQLCGVLQTFSPWRSVLVPSILGGPISKMVGGPFWTQFTRFRNF
jgi:hypothetical protein